MIPDPKARFSHYHFEMEPTLCCNSESRRGRESHFFGVYDSHPRPDTYAAPAKRQRREKGLARALTMMP